VGQLDQLLAEQLAKHRYDCLDVFLRFHAAYRDWKDSGAGGTFDQWRRQFPVKPPTGVKQEDHLTCVGLSYQMLEAVAARCGDTVAQHCYLISAEEEVDEVDWYTSLPRPPELNENDHCLLACRLHVEGRSGVHVQGRSGVLLLDSGCRVPRTVVIMADRGPPHTGPIPMDTLSGELTQEYQLSDNGLFVICTSHRTRPNPIDTINRNNVSARDTIIRNSVSASTDSADVANNGDNVAEDLIDPSEIIGETESSGTDVNANIITGNFKTTTNNTTSDVKEKNVSAAATDCIKKVSITDNTSTPSSASNKTDSSSFSTTTTSERSIIFVGGRFDNPYEFAEYRVIFHTLRSLVRRSGDGRLLSGLFFPLRPAATAAVTVFWHDGEDPGQGRGQGRRLKVRVPLTLLESGEVSAEQRYALEQAGRQLLMPAEQWKATLKAVVDALRDEVFIGEVKRVNEEILQLSIDN